MFVETRGQRGILKALQHAVNCNMCHLRTGSVFKNAALQLSPSPLPLTADNFTS